MIALRQLCAYLRVGVTEQPLEQLERPSGTGRSAEAQSAPLFPGSAGETAAGVR
ncbi:hypothetical protein ACIA98_16790 [Streptomyces sp. NPDC051366]|uniref:hypothetical protein n=1 Tax=Streptomyces sp. NPDC051366 TaxID=3365652 RepID=UPI0037A5D83F